MEHSAYYKVVSGYNFKTEDYLVAAKTKQQLLEVVGKWRDGTKYRIAKVKTIESPVAFKHRDSKRLSFSSTRWAAIVDR